jgi:DHA1 family bicyclomycin/chloramphenicol resistance-like MFS transporter
MPYLLAQIVFGLLAMTICLPSMQEWGEIFSTDATRVQLTFSAYVIAYGLSQVIYGPLSDRYGRRPVVLGGLVIALAGSLGAVFSPGIDELILARAVQGLGAGATMVVGRSLVQDFFAGPERTRVMAFIGMTMGVCPPLATLIGGQLHVHLGWQANPALVFLLGVMLFFLAIRMLPSGGGNAAGDAHWVVGMMRAYRALARLRVYRLHVAILGASTGAFYTYLAAAPLVLRGYGVGPDGVGFHVMTATLSYVVGNFMTSRLIRRLGDQRLMMTGQAITLVAVILMVALAGWPSALAFSGPALVLGVGHGLLMPPTLSGTVGAAPALAGAAAAAAGLIQQLSGAFGGYSVGWVSTEGSLHVALLLTGFTLVGIAGQWGIMRANRRGGTVGG